MRQAVETPAGVVRTREEVLRAEEEARQKKEDEERIAREKAEEEARLEAERRKENSAFTKIGRWLKNFGQEIIKEED